MKREVGWLTGASLIISSMIGSGIFISPQHVLKQSGSVFNSLIVSFFFSNFSFYKKFVFEAIKANNF